jgi:mono/diheme cytochrome c family protein
VRRIVHYNRGVMVRWRIGAVSLFLSCVLVATGFVRAETARAAQADDGLPDGDGKKILNASCTACHDLTEVTKFKGFYTRDDWRDIVKTMIEYGAKVKDGDVDVLVDYLTRNFGKK